MVLLKKLNCTRKLKSCMNKNSISEYLNLLPVSKIIKFLSTGFLNTVFGYFVYAVLIFFGLSYVVALLIATVAGVIFNYFSFGRMVFYSQGGWIVFVKFLISYVVIYIANVTLLSLLVGGHIVDPYLGQFLCIPVGVALSWLLMNNWVYKSDQCNVNKETN